MKHRIIYKNNNNIYQVLKKKSQEISFEGTMVDVMEYIKKQNKNNPLKCIRQFYHVVDRANLSLGGFHIFTKKQSVKQLNSK